MRWASHWLDVIRYGDTHGFEVNTPRDNAWPFRDWVVKSLNELTVVDVTVVVGADFLAAHPEG